MTKIPEPMDTIARRINAWHERRNVESPPTRFHLGVSSLGNPDEAALWLNFRWAFKVNFPGRVLRLFRRGHREEETVVADLIAAGMDVRDTGKHQRHLDFGSHVSGSCDGVIMSGVPHAENTPHLLEIKTISRKRFDELQKHGLAETNWTYWVQVNVYMHGTGLDRCLFVAVCKDDDRIYTERVEYDRELAEKYIARGKRIALAERIPERPAWGPTDYRMKFSDYYAVYFPESAAAEHWQRLAVQRDSTDPLLARIRVNYRTDATSTPREDSTWYSERWGAVIPPEHQDESDEGHVLHPDIMAFAGWTLLDSPIPNVARYRLPGGYEVLNGDPKLAKSEPVFTSEELLANPEACASFKDDPLGRSIRDSLEARIAAPMIEDCPQPGEWDYP